MDPIRLNKEKMEGSFLKYMNEIFMHREIISACVKEIIITRDTVEENGRKAFEGDFRLG